MAEIVTPKNIRDEDKKKYKDIDYVKLTSVQALMELANTLGVKTVFKDGKTYLFLHEGVRYIAKQ
ncbi:MAG: hypothetical protein ACFFDN_15120 [Candidatus Hodarchaeota archaeon]